MRPSELETAKPAYTLIKRNAANQATISERTGLKFVIQSMQLYKNG
jgi:hypothetical protein